MRDEAPVQALVDGVAQATQLVDVAPVPRPLAVGRFHQREPTVLLADVDGLAGDEPRDRAPTDADPVRRSNRCT